MALVSDLTKASTVQLSHEKPKYDQTYSATYDDSLLSGLPAKYIQQSAPFVTRDGSNSIDSVIREEPIDYTSIDAQIYDWNQKGRSIEAKNPLFVSFPADLIADS